LRDELSNKFGINSELIESGGGVFEIKANGHLIFSKKQLGRFPNQGEIIKFIEGLESVTQRSLNEIINEGY
jgi:selenoprotein W-related protein